MLKPKTCWNKNNGFTKKTGISRSSYSQENDYATIDMVFFGHSKKCGHWNALKFEVSWNLLQYWKALPKISLCLYHLRSCFCGGYSPISSWFQKDIKRFNSAFQMLRSRPHRSWQWIKDQGHCLNCMKLGDFYMKPIQKARHDFLCHLNHSGGGKSPFLVELFTQFSIVFLCGAAFP